MRLVVPGPWLENVLKIAAAQFRKDAATSRKAGVGRTMDAFLLQAEQCEVLLAEIEGDAEIYLEDRLGPGTPTLGKLVKLTMDARKYERCKNCNEYHADHVDHIKCPYSSTIFEERPDV